MIWIFFKFYIDGKEFEHDGSLNMKAFVKTIKDKQGKEWAIYDHNLDPELKETNYLKYCF
ncbi:MAG: hypothetical protein CMD72_05330 [Gammaproteobacteria bacterium]|nr:hypothetical protein [Gammaproteobacteria bacterium]